VRIEKTAPVQESAGHMIPGGQIPWAVHLLAAKEYNRHHNQSAEQLADRGGFSWSELIACLRGEYTPSGCDKASKELTEVAEHAQ